MASRRMFSRDITNSDRFLDMPMTARCLYFHLGMEADDDGFVTNPKTLMRMCGASEDDMKRLIAKEYVYTFESGVIVLVHWRVHNAVRKDMYKKTLCKSEFALLESAKDTPYQLRNEPVPDSLHTCTGLGTDSLQVRTEPVTQDRIGKDRLVQVSIDEDMVVNEPLHPVITTQAYAVNCLTKLTPNHHEEINQFIEELSDDIVRHAIDEACALGANTWAYTRKILLAYKDEGVKTLGDAKACDESHNAKAAQRRKGTPDKPKFDYEQRTYTEKDFGEDFFYDPLKEA